MNSIHKLNTLLLVTLLIAVNCMLANSANSAGRPSNEEEEELYTDTNEDEPSQELMQPASTLLPYFEQNNVTVWVKELGTRQVLECPVKNYNEKELILWYKEGNNIALGKSVVNTEEYDVDVKNLKLIIKNYNDNTTVRNFYCEVTPQKIRFHIIVKLGEGGPHVTPPPDQIQVVETPANGSMRFEGIHVYYLVCLLLTAIKLLPAV